MPDLSHLGGWTPDAPNRWRVALTIPTLNAAAPRLFGRAPGGDVFLYRAWKEVLGAYPDYPAQKIGDCTGFGSSHSLDLLTCVEISAGQKQISYLETCTEAVYAMGRELGGMLAQHQPDGGGDGCTGAFVVKALTTMGAVPRKFVGAYSGQRAADWGWHKAPDAVKAEASKYKVGAAAAVLSLTDADAAIDSGRPFIVCSNQGFTMERDSTGRCEPQGSWSHCMSCSGRRTTDRGKEYLIDQSWGSETPSGPLVDDQPPFSFWIGADVLWSMLGMQDSFALDKFGGFEQIPIPARWTNAGWF